MAYLCLCSLTESIERFPCWFFSGSSGVEKYQRCIISCLKLDQCNDLRFIIEHYAAGYYLKGLFGCPDDGKSRCDFVRMLDHVACIYRANLYIGRYFVLGQLIEDEFYIYIYKAYQGDGDGYFGAEIHQHKTKNNNKISVDRRQWGTADTEMKDPFAEYRAIKYSLC